MRNSSLGTVLQYLPDFKIEREACQRLGEPSNIVAQLSELLAPVTGKCGIKFMTNRHAPSNQAKEIQLQNVG